MKLLFSIAVGLAAIMKVIALKELDTSNNKNVSDIFGSLKTVENGFFHLGDDKVLRSYDGNGNVIDYALPEDSHLKAVANFFSKRTQEHVYRVWEDVDSSKFSEEHIWNPPAHLLPLRLSNLPAESESKCGYVLISLVMVIWNVVEKIALGA
ncbi:hypothetical protein GX50_08982 [[Emmonsia] crescens]|uniref:Uncharacterized protein n=1 Tax=[Emmonsia] crescens TaxID=73230 RepID=A0A2B7YRX6_9EURO|nr:hypothetical protein GX50_08982 [Emmonsia crescens]